MRGLTKAAALLLAPALATASLPDLDGSKPDAVNLAIVDVDIPIDGRDVPVAFRERQDLTLKFDVVESDEICGENTDLRVNGQTLSFGDEESGSGQIPLGDKSITAHWDLTCMVTDDEDEAQRLLFTIDEVDGHPVRVPEVLLVFRKTTPAVVDFVEMVESIDEEEDHHRRPHEMLDHDEEEDHHRRPHEMPNHDEEDDHHRRPHEMPDPDDELEAQLVELELLHEQMEKLRDLIHQKEIGIFERFGPQFEGCSKGSFPPPPPGFSLRDCDSVQCVFYAITEKVKNTAGHFYGGFFKHGHEHGPEHGPEHGHPWGRPEHFGRPGRPGPDIQFAKHKFPGNHSRPFPPHGRPDFCPPCHGPPHGEFPPPPHHGEHPPPPPEDGDDDFAPPFDGEHPPPFDGEHPPPPFDGEHPPPPPEDGDFPPPFDGEHPPPPFDGEFPPPPHHGDHPPPPPPGHDDYPHLPPHIRPPHDDERRPHHGEHGEHNDRPHEEGRPHHKEHNDRPHEEGRPHHGDHKEHNDRPHEEGRPHHGDHGDMFPPHESQEDHGRPHHEGHPPPPPHGHGHHGPGPHHGPPPPHNPVVMTFGMAAIALALFSVIGLGYIHRRISHLSPESRRTIRRAIRRSENERRSRHAAKPKNALQRLLSRWNGENDEEKEAMLRERSDSEDSVTMEQEIARFREAAFMVEGLVAVEEGRSLRGVHPHFYHHPPPPPPHPHQFHHHPHGAHPPPPPPPPPRPPMVPHDVAETNYPGFAVANERLPSYDDETHDSSVVSDGCRFTPHSSDYAPSDSASNANDLLGDSKN